MIIDEAAYLEQSGVKGMRWGVRKQRKAEKKAAKKAAKAKADQDYMDAVTNLVTNSAKNKTLISMRVNNRVEIMTGQEAVDRILGSGGRIPVNAIWNELVPG